MKTENISESKPQKWKKVFVREMVEYLFNFAFLSIFLVAFAWYRRLLLASYDIQYIGYWAPLFEAAILAKVIMIGDLLRIGRRFQNKPLFAITIYRSLIFSIFVVLFSYSEHIVSALIHGKTVTDGINEIADKGIDGILAWCIMIFAAFIPFFALKEIEREFGVKKIRGMFFSKQP